MTDEDFGSLVVTLTTAPLKTFGEELQRRGGPPSPAWVGGYVTALELALGRQLESLTPVQVRELVLALTMFWMDVMVGTYVGVAVDQRAALEAIVAGIVERLRPGQN